MKTSLLFLASAALLTANPPRFEITAHTLHSGGVMSDPGGRFTLAGTAGQPEAVPEFTSADSRYALAPGFWPAAVILTTPGGPMLRFLSSSSGETIVAWPAASSGWVLEQSTDLQTWTPVQLPVVDSAGDHTVNISGAVRLFLRLRCP